MKIIKNRLVQVMLVLILLIGIGFILSYDTKPVTASDNVDRGEYLTKIKEIETRLTELSDEIITLKEENTQLKINLENANNKISTLENNKDLSNLKTRVTKIETRENYLYSEGRKASVPLHAISRYILDNLR